MTDIGMENRNLIALPEEALRQVEAGWAAQSAGRPAVAQKHYFEASALLFRAAAGSTGPLKQRRTELAERAFAQARLLGPVTPPHPPAASIAKRAAPLHVDGADAAMTYVPVERPNLRLADVAGLDEPKAQIRLRLVYPFTHPEQASKFGVGRGGGLLLYGPPGTGKTLLARAVAGEVDACFFSVKPSEVMSQWVGVAEQNVERLFATARSCERAVVFVDEVEALVPKRRSSGSTVMQRVVPQILSELEGFREKREALLFIGATNEPWALDSAILRPGRFDERIYVPLPDQPARQRILELNLRNRPLGADVDLSALAEMLTGYSGADVAHVCRKACAIPFVEAVEQGVDRDVCLADFMTTLTQVKPSVSRLEVARYVRYSRGE